MKHRNCANCGTRNSMTRFENESFTIRHEGFTAKVRALSGWRCGACEEVEFDPQSAMQYAEAGDALVLKAREHMQHEIRRIRKKLHLSQAQAAARAAREYDSSLNLTPVSTGNESTLERYCRQHGLALKRTPGHKKAA